MTDDSRAPRGAVPTSNDKLTETEDKLTETEAIRSIVERIARHNPWTIGLDPICRWCNVAKPPETWTGGEVHTPECILILAGQVIDGRLR